MTTQRILLGAAGIALVYKSGSPADGDDMRYVPPLGVSCSILNGPALVR
jgi:hypothetical protein